MGVGQRRSPSPTHFGQTPRRGAKYLVCFNGGIWQLRVWGYPPQCWSAWKASGFESWNVEMLEIKKNGTEAFPPQATSLFSAPFPQHAVRRRQCLQWWRTWPRPQSLLQIWKMGLLLSSFPFHWETEFKAVGMEPVADHLMDIFVESKQLNTQSLDGGSVDHSTLITQFCIKLHSAQISRGEVTF